MKIKYLIQCGNFKAICLSENAKTAVLEATQFITSKYKLGHTFVVRPIGRLDMVWEFDAIKVFKWASWEISK